MTREEVKIEFASMTHDHMLGNKQNNRQANNTGPIMSSLNKNKSNQTPIVTETTNNSGICESASKTDAQSTIAILRRHPMYDSLMLIKQYRPSLKGYSLEFPTSTLSSNEQDKQNQILNNSKECTKTKLVSVYLDGDDPMYEQHENKCKNGISQGGELVYVPMNGLLERLDKYERRGVSVDSRVYSFAMGLKTAERFLKTSAMKEIQETPQV